MRVLAIVFPEKHDPGTRKPMTTSLQPGLRRTLAIPVDERLTVPAVFPDVPAFQRMPKVLATAYMVGLVERVCIELLQDQVGAGCTSVGTYVDVSHVAPTPMGALVMVDVSLESVRSRRLWFKVAVRDDDGLVGEGRHERCLIDVDRFMEVVQRKVASSA